MGLGSDGHFCGNLPSLMHFDEWTVKKTVRETLENYPEFQEILTSETVRTGFKGEETSDYHVTMGLKSVLYLTK